MLQFRVLALIAALLVAIPLTAVAQGQASEDAAIKKVVETMVKAVGKDDLNTMLSQFSDDAKIYSRVAQGQVSKAKYAEIMTEVFKKGDLISADIRDMTVTMANPSRATVLGTFYLVTKTSRPSGRAEYQLEKRDGRWFIVETMIK